MSPRKDLPLRLGRVIREGTGEVVWQGAARDAEGEAMRLNVETEGSDSFRPERWTIPATGDRWDSARADSDDLGKHRPRCHRVAIETSIRVEPGVLTLYAVSLKEHSEQIRLFETYQDAAAYESHLQSPHFKIYKSRTQQMVKGLRLLETEPILLGAKSRN